MIYHFKTIPSTNTYGLEHIDTLNDFDIILADHQSAGRGRFNHQFTTENKQALLMSLIIKRNLPLNKQIHLSSLMGLSIVLALKKLGYDLLLKYPNDLIYENKKCGGILVETKGQNAIIGIGMNLNSHPKNIAASHLKGLDLNTSMNAIVDVFKSHLYLLDDLELLYEMINTYSYLNHKKIHLNNGKEILILNVDGQGKIHYLDKGIKKEMYMHEFSMHSG